MIAKLAYDTLELLERPVFAIQLGRQAGTVCAVVNAFLWRGLGLP
jgi:hypothetical protein